MDIGLPELIIILVILLLLFGANRLPKLARSLGQSAKEIQDGFKGTSSQTATKTSNRRKSNKA